MEFSVFLIKFASELGDLWSIVKDDRTLLASLDEVNQEVVFRGSLHGDQVHAVFPANVPGLEPVHLVLHVSLDIAGIEIAVTIKREGDWT